MSLNRDFVFYYRLQDDLPGRVELVAYRADETKPGTFMLVVTPGLDLQPLNRGADYTFVLDVSGQHGRQDPHTSGRRRPRTRRAQPRRPISHHYVQQSGSSSDPRLVACELGQRPCRLSAS